MLGALLAAFLAAAPFAAHAAGSWAYASAAREAQAQRASLIQVTATLVRAAPVLSGYGSASGFAVEARWRAPDGRSGPVSCSSRPTWPRAHARGYGSTGPAGWPVRR